MAEQSFKWQKCFKAFQLSGKKGQFWQKMIVKIIKEPVSDAD